MTDACAKSIEGRSCDEVLEVHVQCCCHSKQALDGAWQARACLVRAQLAGGDSCQGSEFRLPERSFSVPEPLTLEVQGERRVARLCSVASSALDCVHSCS